MHNKNIAQHPIKFIKHILLAIFIISIYGCVETITVDELCEKTKKDMTLTVAEWWYCGSKDGYHYFYSSKIGFDSGAYRVSEKELKLIRAFPATKYKDKWTLLPWGSPGPNSRAKIENLVDYSQHNCFEPVIPENSKIIILQEHNK